MMDLLSRPECGLFLQVNGGQGLGAVRYRIYWECRPQEGDLAGDSNTTMSLFVDINRAG